MRSGGLRARPFGRGLRHRAHHPLRHGRLQGQGGGGGEGRLRSPDVSFQDRSEEDGPVHPVCRDGGLRGCGTVRHRREGRSGGIRRLLRLRHRRLRDLRGGARYPALPRSGPGVPHVHSEDDRQHRRRSDRHPVRREGSLHLHHHGLRHRHRGHRRGVPGHPPRLLRGGCRGRRRGHDPSPGGGGLPEHDGPVPLRRSHAGLHPL